MNNLGEQKYRDGIELIEYEFDETYKLHNRYFVAFQAAVPNLEKFAPLHNTVLLLSDM